MRHTISSIINHALWGRGSERSPYISAREKSSVSIHPEICPFCHVPSAGGRTCAQCKGSYPLDGCVICFSHSGRMRQLISHMKYRRARHIIPYIAARMAPIIQAHPSWGEWRGQVLCPIPMHWYKRVFVRGYSQTALLAQALVTPLQMSVVPCVRKCRHHRSQKGLSRIQRQHNVHETCRYIDEYVLGEDIHTIVLIDDVFTTGATMCEVARCLRVRYPSLSIWGVVISRSVS